MQRFILPACLIVAGLALNASADETAKGTKVTLDGFTSTTPATWQSETPSNTMRFAQFKLPMVKGDKNDAELVIFQRISGSAKTNVDRWKKQFSAPKDKTLDDISKVSKIKIGGKPATMLEVEGTFHYNPAPFNPRSKTVPRPDYKMIAIQFEGPKEIYHIKLTGPAKTIDHYKKGFDEWIKGFKE